MLRILGGKFKGRRIDSPSNGARPTMGWAREVVFNWLRPMIHDAKVLDACSGTGAMAFESMSWGARRATCLDADITAVHTIQQQADDWGMSLDASVHTWPNIYEACEPYDIVFWDPPYEAAWRHDVFSLCLLGKWLTPGGLLITESLRADTPHQTGWSVIKNHARGQTQLQMLILST